MVRKRCGVARLLSLLPLLLLLPLPLLLLMLLPLLLLLGRKAVHAKQSLSHLSNQGHVTVQACSRRPGECTSAGLLAPKDGGCTAVTVA
jgi:hypothetical protein